MNDASFAQQACQKAVELFHAYCHEHNREKVLSYFSQQSCLVDWGAQDIYDDFDSIAASIRSRMTLPYHLQLGNIKTEVINATTGFCVVLFTADVTFRDNNYIFSEQERATLLFHLEQKEPKIVYLHSSAANRIHSLGKIIPLEHGVEATRRLTLQECDRSMAIDICEHSPNGLIYCLIGEHYPLVYANQTLCHMLGCQNLAELMDFTKGEMDRTIYSEDLSRVKQALLSHVNGVPYTINYRLVNKQGVSRWITERGQYIVDADTEEGYYICTLIPLELDQEDFSYGNLVDYNYIANAKISVEHFLEQTLEYNDFNEREQVCTKLLRHCCETLQASGAVLSAIEPQTQHILPRYYFDANNIPISDLFQFFTWSDLEQYFVEGGFSICTDLNTVPEERYHYVDVKSIRSTMTKLITIKGAPSFLLTVFYRNRVRNWTENEQDIVEQTAKLYSLLLDEDF